MANIPAKILKDAIDIYRQDLKGGLLWQRIVSMFRGQLKEYGMFDFAKLRQFEVHEKYPLDRFLTARPEITINKSERALEATLEYDHHPGFERSSFIDGYRLGVIAIFPDLKKRHAKTAVVYTKVIGLNEKVSALRLVLPIARGAKCFVVCLKIDGCAKGLVNSTPATKGMRMIAVGKI